jgi:vacuolar-type H+-ATPase subunit I/STV1
MKKLMVISIVVIFALGVFILAYAQNPEGARPQEKMSIEQRKAKEISLIDERINRLQELKTCVSAAQTPEDLRKCREKLREERKELTEEMKGQRKK